MLSNIILGVKWNPAYVLYICIYIGFLTAWDYSRELGSPSPKWGDLILGFTVYLQKEIDPPSKWTLILLLLCNHFQVCDYSIAVCMCAFVCVCVHILYTAFFSSSRLAVNICDIDISQIYRRICLPICGNMKTLQMVLIYNLISS